MELPLFLLEKHLDLYYYNFYLYKAQNKITMSQNVIEVPVDTLFNKFSNYLDRNDKGILSAKFGSGKSYFLEKYIEGDWAKEKYLFIPLYPINYQIADNKDIFEYIKRDILLQLFLIYPSLFDEEVIKKYILLSTYIKNNIGSIAEELTSFLPKVSIGVFSINPKDIVKSIKKIGSDYNMYKKSLKNNDIKNVFLDKMESEGSIYEFDPISQLIRDLLNKLRTEFDKKVVLIIEDLDRIDPDHIFRLLNVFSAHNDFRLTPKADNESCEINKFGLDKILMVCDVKNIEYIYEHRYGPNTDFVGYMNKFYTSDVFDFENSDSLKELLHDFFVRLTSLPMPCRNDVFKLSHTAESCASNILLDILIRSNQLTLRQLLHKKSFNLIRQDWDLKYGNALYIVFDFLSELVGNRDMLYKVFLAIPEDKFVVNLGETTINFIQILVPILERSLKIEHNKKRFNFNDYIDAEVNGLWFLKVGDRKFYIQDRFYNDSIDIIKGDSLKEAILLAIDSYRK